MPKQIFIKSAFVLEKVNYRRNTLVSVSDKIGKIMITDFANHIEIMDGDKKKLDKAKAKSGSNNVHVDQP